MALTIRQLNDEFDTIGQNVLSDCIDNNCETIIDFRFGYFKRLTVILVKYYKSLGKIHKHDIFGQYQEVHQQLSLGTEIRYINNERKARQKRLKKTGTSYLFDLQIIINYI